MIDPNHVPPVADDELLARFITQTKQFRVSDQSVKPDLFIPFRLTELSVTRHRDATADELWQVGRDVAALRQQTLYGRSDVRASFCAVGPLSVVADPILTPDEPSNPNHANIVGFPAAKDDQKALAIKIAHRASRRIAPPEGS
jgi:hypothetical protein